MNAITQPLRCLIVEDVEDDALLLLRQLRTGGLNVTWERVETPEAMRAALDRQPWDVILSDYQMPRFSGIAALEFLKASGRDLPFIIVSGTIGETVAVDCMKAGAHDYLMKGSLARLVPAIQREVHEADERRQRREAEETIRRSEERYRLITENASDLIWLYDLKAARFNYISPSVERLLGYTREELQTAKLTTVLTAASAAEARATLAQRIAALAQGDLSHLRHLGRYEHVRKDGTIMIGEVTSTALLDQAGQPTKILGVARDITEREQNRASLEESERRFRTIFEQAGVGVALVGLDGRWMDVNERLCEILRYPREELLQKTFQEVTYAEDLASDIGLVRRAIAGEIPGYTMEKRYVRRDGLIAWALLTVSLVRSVDGQPLHFISVVEDLTARKAAELALQASEHQFKRFMDQIPGLAYIKDASGRTLFANQGFATLLGLRLEEIVGKRSADFFPADFAKKIDAEDQEVLASGATKELEEEFRNRIWMTNKFPIDVEGSAPLLGGITLDVTERRQAEQALKAREEIFSSIVAQANDAIALIEAGTSRFVEFNRAAHEGLGYTREEFAGFRISDIQAEHDESQIRDHVRQILQEGGHTFESRHRHRDGTLRDVRISACPMKLHGRDYLTAVWGDITEQKRTEAEIADRLAFETLLSEVQADFLGAPIEQMEGAILTVQRKFCSFLGVDRCSLWQGSSEAPSELQLCSLWTLDTLPPVPDGVTINRLFPWFTRQLLAGQTVVVPDVAALPPEATTDRDNLIYYGHKSTLAIPLVSTDSSNIGVLSFAATAKPKNWSTLQLNRCGIISQVFALIVARRQSVHDLRREQALLRQSEETLQKQAEELRIRNATLERFNAVAVGRELRMIELKHEVNELLLKLGESPRFRVRQSEATPPATQETPP